MIDILNAKHWHFAYVSAIWRLEVLIWNFDFENEAGKHDFSGVPDPQKLIEIIDGFLIEADGIFEGDIRRFNRMRERLSNQILSAYNNGVREAQHIWKEDPEETLKNYSDGSLDLRGTGKEQVDKTLSQAEQSWFLEGFCRSWQNEWVEATRRNLDNAK